MPHFCPSALKASGGAPTETSSRNDEVFAQTSALSPSTMKAKSPRSDTGWAAAFARCHCVSAIHCSHFR